MQLSVLGGSSPFILGFFKALSKNPVPAFNRVVIHGRNTNTIMALLQFVRVQLPEITCTGTTLLSEACSGAHLILHQIRYGGLEGRADDEEYAILQNLPPDETLGPSALRAALRMEPDLRRVSRSIAAFAPSAKVVNLTNPLSLSTSIMNSEGLDVVGICELPAQTGTRIETLLGIPKGTLRFEYSGLNHRGVMHNFRYANQDLTDDVVRIPEIQQSCGLCETQLREFGAVPTKYYRLFSQNAPVSSPGRAKALAILRQRIIDDLKPIRGVWPTALSERAQPWWDQAVIPLLKAQTQLTSESQIINLVGKNNIAREGRCMVSSRELRWIGSPVPTGRSVEFLEACEKHETACLQALVSKHSGDIAEAQYLDPLLSGQFLSSANTTG